MWLMDARLPPFQQYVLRWYERYGRHELPWRLTTDPYLILLSELMLQQTQVQRVIPKFERFVQLFPTVSSLAQAPQHEVLSAWQGLGYNRRARFLHQTAQAIVKLPDQKFPNTEHGLRSLPGVGPYTSSAILAFAYNQPVPLIETNVRTVFLYHFFPEQTSVSDAQLAPLIEACIPPDGARTWYAALMDYGSHLKKVVTNPSQRSRSYAKQSRFNGSNRQIRGAILRALSVQQYTRSQLQACVETDLGRTLDTQLFSQIVSTLQTEQLIHQSKQHGRFSL